MPKGSQIKKRKEKLKESRLQPVWMRTNKFILMFPSKLKRMEKDLLLHHKSGNFRQSTKWEELKSFISEKSLSHKRMLPIFLILMLAPPLDTIRRRKTPGFPPSQPLKSLLTVTPSHLMMHQLLHPMNI